MEPNTILLDNCQIITMNSDRKIIDSGHILVEGSRIGSIGTGACPKKAHTIIDLQGCLVFPGFINTHAHLWQTIFKGLGDDLRLEDWFPQVSTPCANSLTATDTRLAALLGLMEAVSSGTTFVLDFMQAHPIPGLGCVVMDAMKEIGVCGALGRGYRTITPPGANHAIVEKLHNSFADVLECRKNSSDGISVWLAPTALWGLTFEDLFATAEFSRQYNIPVTMHCLETFSDDAIALKRFGKSTLQILEDSGLLNENFLAVHCVKFAEPELRSFSHHKAAISYNPVSNMITAAGIPPIRAMLDRGIIVALGTDGAASNNTVNMLETIKTGALLQKVATLDPLALRAEEVLEMATINGARAIGLDHDMGSIEVGKRANLVIMNPFAGPGGIPFFNPVSTIAYAANPSLVERVMVNGRFIYEHGKFILVDQNEIQIKGQTAARALAERANVLHRAWHS
jgi:5-methylthioadenosine/S-adenosylhomocysteine deaminase